MKIDYSKINFSHKDIYEEMKKMGLDIELKDEYRFLKESKASNENDSYSLFSSTQSIENKENYEFLSLLSELNNYENLNTSFSYDEDSNCEDEFIEFQNIITGKRLNYGVNKDERLMIAI